MASTPWPLLAARVAVLEGERYRIITALVPPAPIAPVDPTPVA